MDPNQLVCVEGDNLSDRGVKMDIVSYVYHHNGSQGAWNPSNPSRPGETPGQKLHKFCSHWRTTYFVKDIKIFSTLIMLHARCKLLALKPSTFPQTHRISITDFYYGIKISSKQNVTPSKNKTEDLWGFSLMLPSLS